MLGHVPPTCHSRGFKPWPSHGSRGFPQVPQYGLDLPLHYGPPDLVLSRSKISKKHLLRTERFVGHGFKIRE